VFSEARALDEIQLITPEMKAQIPEVIKTIGESASYHAIGKLTPYDVATDLLVDLESLSDLLGTHTRNKNNTKCQI